MSFPVGPWSIDSSRRTARAPDGRTTSLSANETALLLFLNDQTGPVRRSVILTDVFSYAPGVRSRAVDMALNRLRNKLEEDPSRPTLLLSQRDVGIWLQPVSAGPPPSHPVRPYIPRPSVEGALTKLLERWRIVTLVGPPGSGKSRTALETLRTTRTDFVRLAIPESSTIGLDEQLSISMQAQTTENTRLRQVLELRDALVLIDEAENDLRGLRSWLAAYPTTRFLITSRTPTGADEEAIYEIPRLHGEEGRAFLTASCASSRWSNVPPSLDAAVEALDGLPGAIERAVHHPNGLRQVLDGLRNTTPIDQWNRTLSRSLRQLDPQDVRLLLALVWPRDALTRAEIDDWMGPGTSESLGNLADHSLVIREGEGWSLLHTTRAAMLNDADPKVEGRFYSWLADYAVRVQASYPSRPVSALRDWARLASTMRRALLRADETLVPRLAVSLAQYYDDVGPVSSRNDVLRTLQERCPEHPLSWAASSVLPEGGGDATGLDRVDTLPSKRLRFLSLALRADLAPHTVDAEASVDLAHELPPPQAIEARRIGEQVPILNGTSTDISAIRALALAAMPYPSLRVRVLTTLGMMQRKIADPKAAETLEVAADLAETLGMSRWALFLPGFLALAYSDHDMVRGRLLHQEAADGFRAAGERGTLSHIYAGALNYILGDLQQAERYLQLGLPAHGVLLQHIGSQLLDTIRLRQGIHMTPPRPPSSINEANRRALRVLHLGEHQLLGGNTVESGLLVAALEAPNLLPLLRQLLVHLQSRLHP